MQLAQGDFGASLMLNQSVLSAVGERLPVTLSLAGLSLAFTMPVGMLLGSVAAYFRQTWITSVVMIDGAARRVDPGILDRHPRR